MKSIIAYTFITLFTVISLGEEVTLTLSNDPKIVIGSSGVSALNREFPENYREIAQTEAIANAKKQCGGDIEQKSPWYGRHYKNGGSDGETTYWTYLVYAQFLCL